MKKVLVFALAVGISAIALGFPMETNGHWVHAYPPKSQAASNQAGSGSNLTYQGGDILNAAKVRPIFWGSYWSKGTGASEASTMILFYEQFGTNSHYGVITQYYDTTTGSTRDIGLSTLLSSASGAYFDSSNPSSAKVSDAMVQAEVNKCITATGFDNETIYEVFIDPSHYSSSGGSQSCGGHHLAYCAYHGSYTSGANTVKYSIEPYPSCSGCHWTGFTTLNDAQHFACHETREAVTDPVNAWWDTTTGYEADDKCAWSPAPFTDGGYGYQYEWSNAVSGCVQ